MDHPVGLQMGVTVEPKMRTWTFAVPKSVSKNIPDPPGFAFYASREDGVVQGGPAATNQSILEKIQNHMLGAKVYKDYPAMRSIVEELDERFIIGLDPKVLTDSTLIFFKIQKAFWYFKDRFESVIKDKRAPSMPQELFGQLLIEESQVLSKVFPLHQLQGKYREWLEYLRKVPRLGAICINPAGDKVLMIQPFGRGRKCMQFPRGKLHAGEEHAKAAAREVWEECGIRIENLMDPDIFFEATIDQTLHKLYVVHPVMEELVPSIQCNKEIEQILWVPVKELPGWSKNTPYEQDKGYFGVAPFVSQLRAFIKERTTGRSQGAAVQPVRMGEVGSVQILKRKQQQSVKGDELFEENKEDPTADRNNADTFGAGERGSGGWSFEDMLSANSRLGVKSAVYSEQVFMDTYSTHTVVEVRETSVSGGDSGLVEAFKRGWFR